MTRHPRRWAFACTALALFGFVTLAFAGAFPAAAENAKIDGVVKDTSGAAISQVTVTLKPPSGAERRSVTDATGAFSFDRLAPGAYALTMEASGFQKARYINISLTDSQTREFDFMLRPGAVSETLEVDVERPVPQERFDQTLFGGVRDSATPIVGAGAITGRVLNGGGSSAASVTVGVVPVGSSSFVPQALSAHTRTDSLGFYRLDNLPAGRFFVVAGVELFSGSGSVIERPVYFPGVTDISRAVAVDVRSGRDEIADFRLDAPVVLPAILSPSTFRVGGQLVNQLVAVPLLERSQWVARPAWGQLRVTLDPAAFGILGVDGIGPVQRLQQGGCRPPARAAFVSSVSSDGRFDFRAPAGVYDLCVFQAGGRGGAASSGAGWGVFAGPFTFVVDRDIDTLLVDIGRR
ncbi:MAG TPA: carboxypeptidase-like regulatory domain-containing protein [Terriglobia bacterium]|nr:carboxypeptidase-like regulatory domain-containing protein [Terriglobia bacterium]